MFETKNPLSRDKHMKSRNPGIGIGIKIANSQDSRDRDPGLESLIRDQGIDAFVGKESTFMPALKPGLIKKKKL